MLATQLVKSFRIVLVVISVCVLQIIAQGPYLPEQLRTLLAQPIPNRHVGGQVCPKSPDICASWKLQCISNPSVQQLCQQTCGFCGGNSGGGCSDLGWWCGMYKGFCWYPQMTPWCRKTCGKCDGGGGDGPCDDTTCKNGGTCRPSGSSYTCDCAKGYTGRNCQTEEECKDTIPFYCLSVKWQCSFHPDVKRQCKKTCDLCEDGTGANPCDSKPCNNGGSCSETATGFTCSCEVGWTGTTCEHELTPCSSDTCKNGGTCENVEGNFKCTCTSEWTGPTCEQRKECKDKNPFCSYSWQCTWNPQVRRDCKKTCRLCDDDTGPNPCDDEPCKNGGTCTKTRTGFICRCDDGWTGTTCETENCKDSANWCSNHLDKCSSHNQVKRSCRKSCGFCGTGTDPCDDRPCLNGGYCAKTDTGFTCTCDGGWTGTICEQALTPCTIDTCKNGGSCEDVEGNFKCTCTSEWTGPTCEQRVGPCDGKPCKNGGTCIPTGRTCLNSGPCRSYTCNCPAGYTGHDCQIAAYNCEDLAGWCHTYKSSCSTSTYVRRNCKKTCEVCEIECTVTCHENARCNLVEGEAKCVCKDGWEGSGETCTEINACDPDPCKNGGSCSNSAGKFTCDCTAGWTGKTCETAADDCKDRAGWCQAHKSSCNTNEYVRRNCKKTCELCEIECTVTCHENARCNLVEGEAKCVCNDGWEGSGEACTEINACDPDPCTNGGSCTNSAGKFTCDCTAGWTGKTCETEINGCEDEPCKNGGSCGNSAGSFICECEAGWAPPTCEDATCTPDPCLPYGMCGIENNKVVCGCTNQHTGPRCELMCAITCHEKARCNLVDEVATCVCEDGYEGNGDFCSEINGCDPDPCKNGGSCTNSAGSFTCDCTDGWKGQKCQDPSCSPNPCENGGTCEIENNEVVCSCTSQYTGPRCVLMCSPSCHTNARCNLVEDEATCVCEDGYTGNGETCTADNCKDLAGWCDRHKDSCSSNNYVRTNCKKTCDLCDNGASCSPNPCENGGTCEIENNKVVCSCTSQYTGTKCEVLCLQTCHVNAQCALVEGSATCVCKVGYSGNGETTCTDVCQAVDNLQCFPFPDDDITESQCTTDTSCTYCASATDPKKKCVIGQCPDGWEKRHDEKSCCETSASRSGIRIVGGDLAKQGEWPWLVGVLVLNNDDQTFVCGGFLVDNKKVISAAHCMQGNTVKKIIVRLGSVDLHAGTSINANVGNAKVHSGYNYPDEGPDDIMIIIMDDPVTFSDDIQPIKLPGGETAPDGMRCYVAGWGTTYSGGASERYQRETYVEIQPFQRCTDALSGTGSELDETRQICAGVLEGGRDSCQGDSGGPLVCQRCKSCDWYVAGIVSFGSGCGLPNVPAIYTRLTAYRTWLSNRGVAIEDHYDACVLY